MLLVLAATAVPAQASIIGPRASHSPNADDIRTAYWVAIAVVVAIVAVANLALVGVVWRSRSRRGERPPRLAAGRGFFVRAGAPLAVLAVALFIFGVVLTVDAEKVQPSGSEGLNAAAGVTAQVGVRGVSQQALEDAAQTLRNTQSSSPTAGSVPKGGPLMIDVVGQQWLWRFFYPGGPGSSTATTTATTGGGAASQCNAPLTYSASGGRPGDRTFSVNELTVPVDTSVVLNVTSTDVLHRWFIPALGGQVDAVPGQIATTWFRADRTGTFSGQSTAFSGTGFAAMRAWVHVVTVPKYEQFLKTQTREIGQAQDAVCKDLASGNVPGAAP